MTRTAFSPEVIEAAQTRLEAHPVYGAIETREQLCRFMEHHIYSVWDFMSLVKYLQNQVAPASYPWVPVPGQGPLRYFINSLVQEEESDEAPPGSAQGHASHFELYCHAMREMGADTRVPLAFVERVAEAGIDRALTLPEVPAPARTFMQTTFGFIREDRPHCVAAALALGREHIIPGMFRAFLARMGVTEAQAPTFHYYLNRHIHLDADFHGPLSLQLLDALCEGDPDRYAEAEAAAQQAVDARIRFWDGVQAALAAGTAEA
ncbi:DUF3050 domain-containing protein [Alkalilimnicola ehrlichii MLHE-1]|uniref:Heme oxygenase n=1 Tax=Alkalilimnicola ehrlichii (strain ATCC BAA-1101 / DSM 17681 / MLHE-1) TaxID=187272 RepID=Q0A843_ALKEH|nr:DUF3050 domain-containing protein [Alkalilimnicola ehrlichii]ABI56994.1 conserved hypothetical protein [Alkalilimnicola ehrlichii MLHE-1]